MIDGLALLFRCVTSLLSRLSFLVRGAFFTSIK